MESNAQQPRALFNSVGLHYSMNGSGDMGGFSLTGQNIRTVSKNLDWYYSPTMTMHFSKDYSYGFNRANWPQSIVNNYDPMKFYTFGVQAEAGFLYKLFDTKRTPIHISAGPLVRYQSTSDPDSYSFTYSPLRNPDPYYVIHEIQPNGIHLG